MNKFDKLLYETTQRDRSKMLAYFMIHEDLLENKSYNYINDEDINKTSHIIRNKLNT